MKNIWWKLSIEVQLIPWRCYLTFLEKKIWTQSCLNSVRYAFFRVLPVRGCRPSFVRQTAIQIPQIPWRGPATLMSYRQMTKGNVNKAWDCAKGPGDAMSHFVTKSDFRITRKLITRFTAHIFFVNSGEVSMSLRNNNQQSLGIFSHLGSEKTGLL